MFIVCWLCYVICVIAAARNNCFLMSLFQTGSASRNIKVFVTYSDDGGLHRTQVLILCKFLQDNGFACFVDVSEDNSSGRRSLFMESCKQKMAEVGYYVWFTKYQSWFIIGSVSERCKINTPCILGCRKLQVEQALLSELGNHCTDVPVIYY